MADTEKQVKKKKTKEIKPGIVYFSRLPPFMKPTKVRYIFSQYGEIGRLFLQPEGLKHGHKCFQFSEIRFEICVNFVYGLQMNQSGKRGRNLEVAEGKRLQKDGLSLKTKK